MSKNEKDAGMKKTLGLMGLTMNAMALIAPGAFLWITFQVQAAQTDPSGAATSPDIWFGLLLALALAFMTVSSYALLSKRYPDAGTGSSYSFAEKALLDRGSSRRTARDVKFTVGWLRSHVHCLHSFVSAVAEGRPTRPSLEDGVRLQYLLEQARESARDRAWRTISETKELKP